MLKKRFLISLFALCSLLLSLIPPSEGAVVAQTDNCFWQLISETPKSFTVSSAPDASSSVSGTTVTVNWQGLTTTHTWSYPGDSLKPGKTLSISVGVSWSVGDGDARNSTGGLRTSFFFGSEKVSIGDDSISFNAERNGSLSNSGSFTIPVGSKEGATLSIYGHADAAVGGGRVDYLYTYTCPTPTPSVTATITKTPTKTATKCPALTEEQKLSKILAVYNKKIPNGIASSGEKNNIYDLFGYSGYSEFVCGGYQSKVLNLLNSIKFSKDPCEQDLLSRWEFGPIQAWWGGHQAVVIYPWATNWMETGIVLDPWPKQTPMVYSMAEWAVMFSASGVVPVIGNIPEDIVGGSYIGVGESEVYRSDNAYPMFGGTYQQAGDQKFTAEEKAIIESLSAEKKVTFWKLPKQDQKAYLQRRLANQPATQKTIAHCPLNLYVMDANGKRSGVSGNQVLMELPGVSVLALKLTDGTNYTEITYPENAGYSLVLESTGTGEATALTGHTLLMGDKAPAVQQYSFTAEKDKIYQIATDTLGAPMQWDGGSLQPEAITEISPDFLESLPELVSPGEESAVNIPIESETIDKPGLFDWKPPLWLGVLVLLLGLFVFVVGAIIMIVVVLKNKKQQTLAAGQTTPNKNRSLLWVLMTALVLIGCFISSIGTLGVVANLRKTPESSQLPAMDQTLTAIKATEMSLAQKVTENSQILPATQEPTLVLVESPTPEPSQTPTPEPTQTPKPTLTFTPTIEPSPTTVTGTGNQYLDDYRIVDDFSSNTFGWPEMDDGRKILKFEEGGYSFQLKEKDGFDVVYLPVSFKPSEISFDVKGVEGDQDGTYGIFCHFQDEYNYYYVEFDMLSKTYVIAQSLDGEYIPLTAQTAGGQYWHDAESFNEPTEVNKISIGCYLGSIYVLVNDVLVDDVMIANPFTEKGWTALFVYTYDFAGDEGYKVIFDNLEAYEPRQ